MICSWVYENYHKKKSLKFGMFEESTKKKNLKIGKNFF